MQDTWYVTPQRDWDPQVENWCYTPKKYVASRKLSSHMKSLSTREMLGSLSVLGEVCWQSVMLFDKVMPVFTSGLLRSNLHITKLLFENFLMFAISKSFPKIISTTFRRWLFWSCLRGAPLSPYGQSSCSPLPRETCHLLILWDSCFPYCVVLHCFWGAVIAWLLTVDRYLACFQFKDIGNRVTVSHCFSVCCLQPF